MLFQQMAAAASGGVGPGVGAAGGGAGSAASVSNPNMANINQQLHNNLMHLAQSQQHLQQHLQHMATHDQHHHQHHQMPDQSAASTNQEQQHHHPAQGARVQFIVPGEPFDLYGFVYSYITCIASTCFLFRCVYFRSESIYLKSVINNVLAEVLDPRRLQGGHQGMFHIQSAPM